MLTPSFLSVWRNTSCLQLSTRKLNLCMYWEEIFLEDSESFPSPFSYALSKQLPGIHMPLHGSACPGAAHPFLYLLLTKWLCHFLSHKDPALTAHPFKVFLYGLCKDGWSLSDQQEMPRFCSQWKIGQHTSQSTGMDTKENYCTQQFLKMYLYEILHVLGSKVKQFWWLFSSAVEHYSQEIPYSC